MVGKHDYQQIKMETKMRKFLILVILIMLVGCSSKSANIDEDNSIELNHEQLMTGNFSSIAGEYISVSGETIVINNEGLREGEVVKSEVYYLDDGTYQMSLWWGDSDTGGYMITIYPIGIEAENISTDTTKIRIAYGQAQPMSEDEIYTKK